MIPAPATAPLPAVLTLRELAGVIKLSPRTIRDGIHNGTLDLRRLDPQLRHWRFAGVEVARYLQKQAQGAR